MAEPQTLSHIQVPSQAPAEYAINLPEVGGLTGMVLAAVIGFGYVISKFKKDTTSASIEVSLYKNLSDRIESITKTLERVESEREQLLTQYNKAEARLLELERHEKENAILRNKLNEKDMTIKNLQIELDEKQREIDDLRERIHQLEIQMTQKIVQCDTCIHKRIADDIDPPTQPDAWK